MATCKTCGMKMAGATCPKCAKSKGSAKPSPFAAKKGAPLPKVAAPPFKPIAPKPGFVKGAGRGR